MSLTLPIEELGRVCVYVDLGSNDGRISLCLKPVEEIDNTLSFGSGVLIHFDTVVENGSSKLRIFTSSKTPLNSATITPASTPPGSTEFPLHNSYMTAMPSHASPPDFVSGLSPSSMGVDLPLPDSISPSSESGLFDEYFSMHSDTNIPFYGESVPLHLSHPSSESDMYLSLFSAATTLFEEESSPITATEPAPSDPTPHSGTRRPRRLSCLHPQCKQRFMSEYTRKLHMGKHGPKTRFPCEMGCRETFSRQHDRLRHEIAKHGRPCEWVCDNCRRFFSSHETRSKHKCTGTPSVSRWTQPITTDT